MPASKPVPREADGTVDIKQARKRMRGHRTDAEIEEKAKHEVRAKEPKRITVPKPAAGNGGRVPADRKKAGGAAYLL